MYNTCDPHQLFPSFCFHYKTSSVTSILEAVWNRASLLTLIPLSCLLSFFLFSLLRNYWMHTNGYRDMALWFTQLSFFHEHLYSTWHKNMKSWALNSLRTSSMVNKEESFKFEVAENTEWIEKLLLQHWVVTHEFQGALLVSDGLNCETDHH